jgi:peroxiredoxin
MPFLQQVHQDWPEDELVLLGVNIGESPSQAAEFMQSNGLSFTVLLDSQTAVAQKYNIEYIPTTFLIDRKGIIQEIKVGSFQSKAEIENMLSQID